MKWFLALLIVFFGTVSAYGQQPPVVYVHPAPVYVAPAPVYVAPAPPVYVQSYYYSTPGYSYYPGYYPRYGYPYYQPYPKYVPGEPIRNFFRSF